MYNELTNEEKLLVNSEVANNKKSTGIAYALWFFLGGLGIHRFYLNRKGSGLMYLVLEVLGWVTLLFAIGFVFFLAVGIWMFVDLFLIGKMVREENDKITEEYARKVIQGRQYAAQ